MASGFVEKSFAISLQSVKLTALIAHYNVGGVEARKHWNKRKRPFNAQKLDDTSVVIDFIVNYAEANAINVHTCIYHCLRLREQNWA